MLPVLVIAAVLAQTVPALPSVTPPAKAPASAADTSAAPAQTTAVAATTTAPVTQAPAAQAAAPATVATPEQAPVVAASVVQAAPPPAAKPGMIKVDAYHEKAGDRTDSNIWSAFAARQSESGPMEGTWVVVSADGKKLVSLELRVDAASQKLEGAWRSLTNDVGLTRSGFLSDLFLDGPALEINYARSKTATPNVLELRKGTDGAWHGVLLDAAGHKTDVVMSQAVHAG